MHAAPPAPQRVSLRPSRQTPLASQQPEGHVLGPHVGTNAQYPPGTEHLRPLLAQLVQLAPFVPQVVTAVPVWQTPCASQQPPQLAGPQAGGGPSQTPALQPSPVAAQFAHERPPAPQASLSAPLRHTPLPSQQPAQVMLEHSGGLPLQAPFWQSKPSTPQSVHTTPPTPQALT